MGFISSADNFIGNASTKAIAKFLKESPVYSYADKEFPQLGIGNTLDWAGSHPIEAGLIQGSIAMGLGGAGLLGAGAAGGLGGASALASGAGGGAGAASAAGGTGGLASFVPSATSAITPSFASGLGAASAGNALGAGTAGALGSIGGLGSAGTSFGLSALTPAFSSGAVAAGNGAILGGGGIGSYMGQLYDKATAAKSYYDKARVIYDIANPQGKGQPTDGTMQITNPMDNPERYSYARYLRGY